LRGEHHSARGGHGCGNERRGAQAAHRSGRRAAAEARRERGEEPRDVPGEQGAPGLAGEGGRRRRAVLRMEARAAGERRAGVRGPVAGQEGGTTMKRETLCIPLALLLAAPAMAADVVGKIGGTEVTATEVRAYVETLPASDQAALAKDPSLL